MRKDSPRKSKNDLLWRISLFFKCGKSNKSWQLEHGGHLGAVNHSHLKDRIYELPTCLLGKKPVFIKRKTKINAQISLKSKCCLVS